MTRFEPTESTQRELRDALGQFATGVTVITCMADGAPLGMTANSFASVSLDPPLVLWSPAKSSARHDSFVRADHFCVHVLAADQTDLCRRFTKDGRDFSGVSLDTEAANAPLISGCLTRFECDRDAVHPAGDHTIILGRVTGVVTRVGEPLVFSKGRMGGFAQREA